LLAAIGVTSITQLAEARPEDLFCRMIETNESQGLVRRIPSLNQVYNWVREAVKLPRIVT
jgi:hypothetical protein